MRWPVRLAILATATTELSHTATESVAALSREFATNAFGSRESESNGGQRTAARTSNASEAVPLVGVDKNEV